MPFRISWSGLGVVSADLAINAKQSFEYSRPGIFGGAFRGNVAESAQISPAELLNRVGEGCRAFAVSPAFLVVQDNSIEPRPANPDDWRPARLTFQRDQAERLLRSRVNEQIRGSI